jgi:BirA family biotin operon repressor/biotin-[acetyl-CoA-carboxylase] ligase
MRNFNLIREKTFVADLEHHFETSSTNDLAIARATEKGAKLPLLIVADCQTAGRGRGSNRWWTGPGSLAFSVLIGPDRLGGKRISDGGTQPWPLISLAVGVAVVEALAPFVPGHEIGIHWPNDCVIDGRKVAGILIEVQGGGKHVIGIGINTNNTAADAPEEVRPRVVTLRDVTGREHDSVEVLISVMQQLERQLFELARSPEAVAARTNELCQQRGKQLEVVRGECRITGQCLGIAPDGALLLEVDGQSLPIYSGVVASESL